MKVLVVEDNVSLLESIRQILTDEYEVDTADNGEDGLFMAQQSIYDIIILDVIFRESMDLKSSGKSGKKNRYKCLVFDGKRCT